MMLNYFFWSTGVFVVQTESCIHHPQYEHMHHIKPAFEQFQILGNRHLPRKSTLETAVVDV